MIDLILHIRKLTLKIKFCWFLSLHDQEVSRSQTKTMFYGLNCVLYCAVMLKKGASDQEKIEDIKITMSRAGSRRSSISEDIKSPSLSRRPSLKNIEIPKSLEAPKRNYYTSYEGIGTFKYSCMYMFFNRFQTYFSNFCKNFWYYETFWELLSFI